MISFSFIGFFFVFFKVLELFPCGFLYVKRQKKDQGVSHQLNFKQQLFTVFFSISGWPCLKWRMFSSIEIAGLKTVISGIIAFPGKTDFSKKINNLTG